MAAGKGSSAFGFAVELVIAILVGMVAVAVGLIILGFLLVDPQRDPVSNGSVGEEFVACDGQPDPFLLPAGCSLNGSSTVPRVRCDRSTCTATSGQCLRDSVDCCCLSGATEDFSSSVTCDTGTIPVSSLSTQLNSDSCFCMPCNTQSATVFVTIFVRDVQTQLPIEAAQIFDVATDDSLGLTLASGTFTFAASVPNDNFVVSYRIQASDYLDATITPSLPFNNTEVTLTVGLVPAIILVELGNGDSALSLFLSDTTVLFAQPNTFLDENGVVYNDTVSVRMAVMDPIGNFLDALPSGSLLYDNGSYFGIAFAARVDFMDDNSQVLGVGKPVTMSFRTADGTGDENSLFVATYDESTGMWTRKNVTLNTITAKKRQAVAGIFETELSNIGDLIAIAVNLNLDCWAGVRVISSSNEDVVFSLVQINNIFGMEFFLRIDATGPANSTGCVPLSCANRDITETRLTAVANPSGNPFRPVDLTEFIQYNDTANDPAPVVVGEAYFIITPALTAQQANESRPLYDTLDNCQIASNVSANFSDFFTFRGTVPNVPTNPTPTVQECFVKVQLLDCIANDIIVTAASLSPDVFNIETITVPMGDFDVDIFSGDPENCTNQYTESVCIPYNCETQLRLSARNSSTDEPCMITGLAPDIMSRSDIGGINMGEAFVLDTSLFSLQDLNTNATGLYYSSAGVAEGMALCNANNDAFGYAVQFSCSPELL